MDIHGRFSLTNDPVKAFPTCTFGTGGGFSDGPLTPRRTWVYFDLETGGLLKEKGILQIAGKTDDKLFNKYVKPVSEISREASKVNGITCSDGNLKVNGTSVASSPVKEALEEFLSWLSEIGYCNLVGHNVTFDLQFIFHYLEKYNLKEQFFDIVFGYVDTLSLFKSVMSRQNNYKLDLLVHEYFESSYKSHNAFEDVKSLEELVKTLNVDNSELLENTISLSSIHCEKKLETNSS